MELITDNLNFKENHKAFQSYTIRCYLDACQRQNLYLHPNVPMWVLTVWVAAKSPSVGFVTALWVADAVEVNSLCWVVAWVPPFKDGSTVFQHQKSSLLLEQS
ncbi:MAG: hypothetical protein KBD36_03830 [Alphaproteobacteria bacterium]|nr:hypothetical protein [Alphaproteobacteria bacterium]MBP9776952.1 hypothetical protein [Alphaproteobacteria bacterium]